jgi:hypothetical protein
LIYSLHVRNSSSQTTIPGINSGNISSFTGDDASINAAMQADVCKGFLVCLNERETPINVTQKAIQPNVLATIRADIRPNVYCLLISDSEEQ